MTFYPRALTRLAAAAILSVVTMGALLMTVTPAVSAATSAGADTAPPSAPGGFCAKTTNDSSGHWSFVLRWSPSIDNVDTPDQITYLIWDATFYKGTPVTWVVGTTEAGPFPGAGPDVAGGMAWTVINAMDRAGNQSQFVSPAIACV
jgi:hypothetical protein